MNKQTLKTLLQNVAEGKLPIDQALQKFQAWPFEDAGFAKIDHHRSFRCGIPETIYCPGKTTHQIVDIFKRLAAQGQNVLATRVDDGIYEAIRNVFPQAQFEEQARCVILRQEPAAASVGRIALVTGGTSDIPVAEEARVIAELLNQNVETIYDVGVAGLHRLLGRCEQLQQAHVVIVVAGMEGALPSVVAGLVSVPVIAVPTSTGYGTNFAGVAPLLTMLNSCSAGVSVVNIDNGFAAGFIASRMNELICQGPDKNRDK